MRRLKSVISTSVGINVYSLAAGFLTTLLLTKWIGAIGLGTYNFVTSWMLIIVVVVRAGLPGYITRELAICFDQNRPDLAAQIWRKAQCIVLIGSLIAVVTAILILCQIEFVDSEIRSTFYIAMLMVPLLGIIGLFRGLFC